MAVHLKRYLQTKTCGTPMDWVLGCQERKIRAASQFFLYLLFGLLIQYPRSSASQGVCTDHARLFMLHQKEMNYPVPSKIPPPSKYPPALGRPSLGSHALLKSRPLYSLVLKIVSVSYQIRPKSRLGSGQLLHTLGMCTKTPRLAQMCPYLLCNSILIHISPIAQTVEQTAVHCQVFGSTPGAHLLHILVAVAGQVAQVAIDRQVLGSSPDGAHPDGAHLLHILVAVAGQVGQVD